MPPPRLGPPGHRAEAPLRLATTEDPTAAAGDASRAARWGSSAIRSSTYIATASPKPITHPGGVKETTVATTARPAKSVPRGRRPVVPTTSLAAISNAVNGGWPSPVPTGPRLHPSPRAPRRGPVDRDRALGQAPRTGRLCLQPRSPGGFRILSHGEVCPDDPGDESNGENGPVPRALRIDRPQHMGTELHPSILWHESRETPVWGIP